jgi:AcrR family transcriptional regulator
VSTRIPFNRFSVPTRVGLMRKRPVQARSRATVEVILQAGARVLGARGFDGFTTNEVADVAGVSIGSLYQYFPDRIVLIDSILERHLDAVLRVLREVAQGEKPLRQRIGSLVDGLIAIHSEEQGVHHVLLELAPVHGNALAMQNRFEADYLAAYAAILALAQGHRTKNELAFGAQVLSSAVEGIIHNAARRGILASQALRGELVSIIYTYLENADGG